MRKDPYFSNRERALIALMTDAQKLELAQHLAQKTSVLLAEVSGMKPAARQNPASQQANN